MTTTIREAGNLLRKTCESIDASRHVVLEELAPGRAYAQGDVAILSVGKRSHDWEKIKAPDNGQIAPGTTRGSRHCVRPSEFHLLTFYRIADNDRLSDLGIIAKAPWTLEHPEHAWITFPAGAFRVLHQQNGQRERVLD